MTITGLDDIVSALRELPGVADADVEPDPVGGGVGLLRLGLTPGVDEVAVASTVGRLLRERFGLSVDAQRIALIEDAATAEPPPVPGDRRPSIQRMHIVSSGLDITATVTLGFDGRTLVGEEEGTATQSGIERAVAAATLRACEVLLEGRARFVLEHLQITPTGRDRTALVSVSLITDQGTDKLTGTAIVREDPRQAVIRAALDAVNRRLSQLLS